MTVVAVAVLNLGPGDDLTAIAVGAIALVGAALLVWRDWRLATRGVCVTGRLVGSRVEWFQNEASLYATYEYEYGGRRLTTYGTFYFRWRRPRLPPIVDVVLDPDHPRVARILWRRKR